MTENTARDNWMPDHVVNFVAGLTAREVVGAERHRMFLLARVTANSQRWMAESSGHSLVPAMEADQPLVQLSTRIHDFATDGGPDAPRAWGSRDEQVKLAEATSEPHFLFPVQKRKDGAAFLNKVTVGRTGNHDVVLRDASVSKYHASLEILDDGSVMVQDVQSKNHTLVNGKQVERSIALPGDDLQFGSIKTILCTAEGLWRSMRS